MLKGIDVAVWQGGIDWKRVGAAGIDFALIKATQGRAVSSGAYLFKDRYFEGNITGASDAGIACGAYHYLTALNPDEAAAEAGYFTSALDGYRSRITLWAAVDVENGVYLPKDRDALTEVVNVFCESVSAAGYKPMIYTNADYLTHRLGDISRWPLWLALWRDPEKLPSGYRNMMVWQYGSSQVDGVDGAVDSNLGFYDGGSPAETIAAGDRVSVVNAYIYGTANKFRVWYSYYDVIDVSGDRVIIGCNGVVTAAVAAENLRRADVPE